MTNKIHNKGARLKHIRVERNKLEPKNITHHFENEDSVPPLLDSNEVYLTNKESSTNIENKIDPHLNNKEREFVNNTNISQTVAPK